MRKIEYDILRYLDERSEWKTSSMLSAHFGISVRKVKYIIAQWNQEYPLIISSKKGYKTNAEWKHKIEEIMKTSIIDEEGKLDAKSRRQYLLKQLTLNEKGCNLFDISDELFFNPTSLRQEILSLKPLIERYHLSLTVKHNVYSIQGSEKNKRKVISMLLADEAKKGFVLENVMHEMFTEKEICDAKEILRKHLKQYAYSYNEYAFMNLLIHLLIVIDRNRNGFNLKHIPLQETPISYHCEVIAKDIFHNVQAYFGVGFSNQEIQDFSMLIESQTQKLQNVKIKEKDLQTILGDEVYSLVQEIIKKVNEVYYLDLSEDTFLIKFALHIKNLLLRIQLDRSSNNPYVEYIKSACPFIYEVSVYIANLIYEYCGYLINDNEIAFLALHVSCIFDKNLTRGNMIKAVLVCPSYHDVEKSIVNRLKTSCANQLEFHEIVNNEIELKEHIDECELILSTISLASHYRQEVVFFSPLLNVKEIQNVKYAVQRLLHEREIEKMKTTFLSLFSSSLFFNHHKMAKRDDVIAQMCQILVSEGYVDSSYVDKVKQREHMSPTIYGKVAVPHALKPCAMKSAICVAINDKGIQWEDKVINVILLIAIHPQEQLLFNEAFHKITEILCDDENISRIMHCRTFDEFMNALLLADH